LKPVNYHEIDQAWWDWGRDNYTGRSKSDRALVKWMYANMAAFVFDGETWTRSATSLASNSGKTSYWNVTYTSTGGRTATGGSGASRPINRRNDPERNWGLPE
jgi:hypothetical protein